jgi:predicted DNA-binding transcriptional regulator AlpA
MGNKAKRVRKKSNLPFAERVTASVNDVVAATGICRSAVYGMIKKGEIESRKRGKSRLVVVPSVLRLLNLHSSAA